MFNKEKNTSFPQTPSVSSANWSVQGNFTPCYQSGWVCPKCGKATRVAHKLYEDGKKDRMCKKCGETF